MILKNEIILYHGSYEKIEKIDLSKCQQGKDFGAGFYLTTDYIQAKKFIRTSIAKAVKNKIIPESTNAGFASSFKFSEIADLKIFEFEKADKNWLHFVAGNRRKRIFEDELKQYDSYDIISGKIANDATNRVITAYLNGVYGQIGSPFADRTAIELLLQNTLTNQVCFRTEKSISCLSFLQAEEISL